MSLSSLHTARPTVRVRAPRLSKDHKILAEALYSCLDVIVTGYGVLIEEGISAARSGDDGFHLEVKTEHDGTLTIVVQRQVALVINGTRSQPVSDSLLRCLASKVEAA